MKVPIILTRFLHTVPKPTLECLNKKPEVRALLKKFDIEPDTSLFSLKFRLNSYTHRHPRRVHREMKTLRTLCERKEFKIFGERVSVIFHDIYDRDDMMM